MIEIVSNYDVTFEKIFTIWLRVALKDVTQLFRLTVTKSGNDATPIDPYNKILTNVLSGINVHVTLIVIDNAK